MEQPAVTRIDDIEILRAFAILYVLIGHTPAMFGATALVTTPGLRWESGVDLFFVISGFVIARSLIDHIGTTLPRDFLSVALPFWIRRAFRILPAAWFGLAVGLLACRYFNSSTAFPPLHQVIPDATAAFLQYANFHIWNCQSPGVVCAPGGVPFGPYWSLSLEEQFYLLFPFAALLLPRRLFVAALFLLIVLQLGVAKPGHIRTDGFAIGILLALWKQRQPDAFEPRFLGNAVARLLAFVVLGALLLMPPPSLTLHDSGLVTMVGGLWVFCASFDKGYVLPIRFLRSVLLWLGTRSYALYVMHLTAFSGSHEILFLLDPSWVPILSPWTRYTPAGIVTLVVVAEFTYRFIELPLRDTGRRLAQRWPRLRPATA